VIYEIAPEWLALQELTRAFVRRELQPLEREVEARDEIRPEVASEIRAKAIQVGIFAYNMPIDVGGQGLPYLAQVLIREELAKVTMALADTVGRPPRILLHSRGQQRERYLLPAIRGEKLWAFALTEPNRGSDVAALETIAMRHRDEFVLNGTKRFISHGSEADFAIVFAQVIDSGARLGPSAFIVDAGTSGFSVGPVQRKMGWRGYPLADLVFQDCRLSVGNLLGEVGQGLVLALEQINEARLGVAAHCIGMSQRALDLAIAHAQSRIQFGRPIAQFQGLQWMLAEMATDIECCRALVYAVARSMDAGEEARVSASMAKLSASEMACRVADRALQIFGGAGYMADSPIEMIYRDARAFRIGEGTSEIQKNLIASHLIGREGARMRGFEH
jgi:acyl-CoA dehydrogenase